LGAARARFSAPQSIDLGAVAWGRLGRIDTVLPTGKNRDRIGCDAGAMRGGIDAAGETGRDGKSRRTQAARQAAA
jgi:hypothetical protein